MDKIYPSIIQIISAKFTCGVSSEYLGEVVDWEGINVWWDDAYFKLVNPNCVNARIALKK